MSGWERSASRFAATAIAGARKTRLFQRAVDSHGNLLKPSDFFGCNVFSYETMSEKLSPSEIAVLKEFATSNTPLDFSLADKVAQSVKEWAIVRGVTHYSHWFQPQTGATAEKHDSFFSFDKNSKPIEHFTGKQLIQSEPDASSFPSGGRRSTFEARGYTAWDASSPMFIMETENGSTLCIPSVFISYSGEALDQKTPLLRSLSALSRKAVDALRLMGSKNVDHVIATAGPEQEYFVIDEALFNLRPDLIQAGRTLLGRVPPKGQQLEDHYFGSIKPRVLNFMMEAEYELYKLGVPVKTRHNEVAPSQCEAAPIFEHGNVAADHNQLMMEVLRLVAKRHGLVTLFHEKPYAGMNGSGKHVNWSLADNHGNNLLEPGDAPHDNIRFLYFLVAAVKSVHDHGALLRSSVASPGNDFRLGANEAPPAIMSVFLGETLTEVLERVSSNEPGMTHRDKVINLDLAKVPVISRDNTDRNRTSPFAFTGNKFEFRAVGASASISPSLSYLNAAMAKSLEEMNALLQSKISGGMGVEVAILAVVKEIYQQTKKVCFEGNNYGSEWHKEAENRGLPHAKTTPDALACLIDPKVAKFLVDVGVYHAEEVTARYNVRIERYVKVRLIELETMLEMVSTQVLPAAYGQLKLLGDVAKSSKDVMGTLPDDQRSEYATIAKLCSKLSSDRDALKKFIHDCHSGGKDEAAVARTIATDGMKLMDLIRDTCNELELHVDDHIWSLPKYREMIYMI